MVLLVLAHSVERRPTTLLAMNLALPIIHMPFTCWLLIVILLLLLQCNYILIFFKIQKKYFIILL